MTLRSISDAIVGVCSAPTEARGTIWVNTLSAAIVSAALVACDAGAGSGNTASASTSAEKLVEANGCGSCHTGTKGTLAGGDVARGNVYPPNLTPDMNTGLGGWTTDQIMTAIAKGDDDQGVKLCSSMPRFNSLSPQDLAEVAAYLRRLPAVKNQVPNGICADP